MPYILPEEIKGFQLYITDFGEHAINSLRYLQ